MKKHLNLTLRRLRKTSRIETYPPMNKVCLQMEETLLLVIMPKKHIIANIETAIRSLPKEQAKIICIEASIILRQGPKTEREKET